MTRNVSVSWDYPATREQGGPLDPADIAGVRVELSADGGSNYSDVGTFAVPEQSALVADLPFSDQYAFRLRCIDTQGQVGQPVVTPFEVADTSPPGQVQNVTVAFP